MSGNGTCLRLFRFIFRSSVGYSSVLKRLYCFLVMSWAEPCFHIYPVVVKYYSCFVFCEIKSAYATCLQVHHFLSPPSNASAYLYIKPAMGLVASLSHLRGGCPYKLKMRWGESSVHIISKSYAKYLLSLGREREILPPPEPLGVPPRRVGIAPHDSPSTGLFTGGGWLHGPVKFEGRLHHIEGSCVGGTIQGRSTWCGTHR